MSRLPIASIERAPELNCRAAGVNERVARDYAEATRQGAAFPAVVVFRDPDGRHWLADGWHRVRAHELAGMTEIAVDLREGNQRDALLFAAGANAAHGARRSNKDKRRAVTALLADPEWRAWSDGVIAEKTGVSQPFVSAIRRWLERAPQNGFESGARRGRDGRVTNGQKRKRRRKLSPDRVLDLAVKSAQCGLERLVKEWPEECDRSTFATTVEAWLKSFEQASSTTQ